MIRSQAVRDLVLAAVERLLECEHPPDRKTGKDPCYCARCGAVELPEGIGWSLPTQLQSIQELIEAARAAETVSWHHPGEDKVSHPVTECGVRGCNVDHPNRGC